MRRTLATCMAWMIACVPRQAIPVSALDRAPRPLPPGTGDLGARVARPRHPDGLGVELASAPGPFHGKLGEYGAGKLVRGPPGSFAFQGAHGLDKLVQTEGTDWVVEQPQLGAYWIRRHATVARRSVTKSIHNPECGTSHRQWRAVLGPGGEDAADGRPGPVAGDVTADTGHQQVEILVDREFHANSLARRRGRCSELAGISEGMRACLSVCGHGRP